MPGLPRVGETVDGRFELLGFAGSGGMGAVFRAHDRTSGNVVALKLLEVADDLAHHPGRSSPSARFEREAQLLASIDHAGIVRYFDHGVTRDGMRFLVMEWLSGVDLEAWLARGTLTWEHALSLARRVAEALDATHRRGVVHRDLKPANLLLVDDRIDAVKLVDFGIAESLDRLDEGDAGMIVGTPEYMAPEALRGEAVDPRADIYGLGAVLFRCLAGRAVFTGAQRLAILAKVLLEVPPPIGELRADVPIELEDLISQMLAKAPAERPADGAALLRALGDVEHAAAAAANPASARRRRPAITAGEQRVTCIVMCGGRDRRDTTVPIARLGLEHELVEEAAKRAGGVLEVLPSGSLLVHIAHGTPAERAAHGATCALAIAAVRSTTPIVVATGQIVQTDSSQVGEVIDRAAAEVIAAQGREGVGVWIDATTASLLDERFELGASDNAWRPLLGERDAIAPVRMFLGRPAACVGRAAELTALQAALDDSVSSPRARVALIVAAPGFGKSRLVHELLAVGRRGAMLFGARGEAVSAGSPFSLVARLLARAAELADADPPAARRAKLAALFARDLPAADARRCADLLAELVAAPVAAAEASPELCAARADPAVMTDALRACWCDWLGAIAARGPIILVLEDLHWGDLPSIKLIGAALAGLAAQPLMVVATARPEIREVFPQLWASYELWEMRLGAISRRASEQVVRAALGASCNDAIVAALVERAGGHPFHLEEMVRAIAGGAGADALPETVLGMVQARLDVLGLDARRVLRAASVFGASFWSEGVASLIGDAMPREAVDQHLAALCEQEIIGRQGGELVFRHALVRDAVYATLPEGDRAVAHRAAGNWLEAAGVADAAMLAEHFERGGAPQRARHQLRRAAEQALGGEDQLRAAGFVERALRCGPDEAELGKLFAIESEIALWRGDFDHAAERAAAATARLEPGTAPWFDAIAGAITALGQRGHNARVADQLDRAATVEVAPGAAGACATALCRGLTQLYWAHYRGELARPRRRIETLGELEPYHAGWVHRVRAESAWLHDHDIDACLATFAAAEAGFAAACALRPLCLTRINSASLAAWSGAIERSRRLVTEGLADAARLGSGFLATYGRVVQVVVSAYAGDPDAPRAFRGVLDSVRGSPRLAFLCRLYLGWLADDAGDAHAATTEATAALELPVGPELRAAGLALRSCVERRRGELDAAVASAEAAVALERDSRDLELTEGFPTLALAEALDARGQRDAAREALALGHARLATIAATIASSEQRAAFLGRQLPNARLVALARAWGLT